MNVSMVSIDKTHDRLSVMCVCVCLPVLPLSILALECGH